MQLILHFGYDIILFSYDWRKDPYYAAQDLDLFINSNCYTDIVLIGHSMGGIVASQYIALGEEQREKIDKFISVGTPFLGSVKLINVFATGIITKIESPFELEEAIKGMIYNIPAIYSMIPRYAEIDGEIQYDCFLKYTYEDSPDTCTTVYTYDAAKQALENYMPNWNKAMADSVIANGERLFLENGEHVTTLVDSYYIVGTGEETFRTLEFTLNEARDSFILDSGFGEDNQDDVAFTETTDGDGTVLMNSATVFESFAANRVFVKSNEDGDFKADHTKIISKDISTSYFISRLIDGTYEFYPTEGLYNNYGLVKGYA